MRILGGAGENKTHKKKYIKRILYFYSFFYPTS